MSGRDQSEAAAAEMKLRWKLRYSEPLHRAAAVKDLAPIAGPRALEPLCEALRDSDLSVRVAAAEELGRLRDERAVPALIQAFGDSLEGKSARWQARTGLALNLVWPIGLVAFALLLLTSSFPWYVLAVCASRFGFPKSLLKRLEVSPLQAAVSTALAEIAEHRRVPEVGPLVDQIRTVAQAYSGQLPAARRACREAARRIEVATAGYRDLPLAAAPPDPSLECLPAPAAGPDPDQRSLPRVRD